MDALGIYLKGEKILSAHLKRNKKNTEIIFLGEQPYKYAQGVKVVSGLNGSEFILRKLSLKLKSKFAIRKVLPFQAEAILPYPKDELILLPFSKKTAKAEFDTTLFATTHTLLEKHLKKLHTQDFDPDQISCAPAAIWRFSQHFFPEEKNLFFFHFCQETSFCGLILNGELLQVYTLSTEADYTLNSTEPPLSLQKELDRAFSFLQKRSSIPIEKLLLTGEPFINLKTYLQEVRGLTVLEPPTPAFAIPIGLALEGLASDPHVIEFRQGDWVSAGRKKKRDKFAVFYLASMGFLTLLTFGSMLFFSHKKEDEIRERLSQLPQMKNAPYSNHQEALSHCENALAKEKKSFPFSSSAPLVSDLLTWISIHPKLSEEIDVKEVHYQLVKHPKIESPLEPYLTKVELKFTASTPAAARIFREALIQGDHLVNPKSEITWNLQQNIYQATFYLRGNSS
jgi:type IV pilus assembly protein PilM